MEMKLNIFVNEENNETIRRPPAIYDNRTHDEVIEYYESLMTPEELAELNKQLRNQ